MDGTSKNNFYRIVQDETYMDCLYRLYTSRIHLIYGWNLLKVTIREKREMQLKRRLIAFGSESKRLTFKLSSRFQRTAGVICYKKFFPILEQLQLRYLLSCIKLPFPYHLFRK